MKKELIAIVFTTLMIATAFAIFGGISSTGVNSRNPVGVPDTSSSSYYSITLTNSQNTPTPKDFQQLLKMDWETFATYLNSNVSNVRFYNSTTFTSAYELSGWIETNNTTTATSSNVWVNLSNTIVPADGSVKIYMAFLAKTASWSSHWGLAPELSTKYGQFDNGANVFSFYDNFAGTTLASDWTFSTADGAPSPTVDNGITFGASSARGDGLGGQIMYNNVHTFSLPGNFVFDSLITAPTFASGEAGISIWGQLPAASTGLIDNSIASTIGPGPSYKLINVNSTGGFSVNSLATNGDSGVMSVLFPTTSITGMQINYSTPIVNTADIPSSSSTYYFGFTIGGGATMTAQWIGVRYLPPNDVMPSVSIRTYNVTFTISFIYDHTWNITVGKTNHIQITNTTTFNHLLNGTYTYNASVSQPSSGDMYHIKNLTGTFTVNGSNVTIHLNFGVPVHSFAIPIKLYNNQSSPVVVNTPILIHVDWAKYFPYILNNVSDVRFYTNNVHYYTIYELPAWLQSGNSALDTTSTVWINLESDSIAAHSSIVIYMYINGSNTWSKYWGESPLLSSTYAKHDNGANVFQVYWNFAGTSMAGWNRTGSGSDAGSGLNNGLQQSASDTGGAQTVAVNTTPFTTPYIFDVNLSLTGASYSNSTILTILTGSDVGYYATAPFGFTASGLSLFWISKPTSITSSVTIAQLSGNGGANGENSIGNLEGDGIGTAGVMPGLYWPSTTAYIFKNYVIYGSVTILSSPSTPYYLGWSMSNNQFSTSTANQTIHYLDGRIPPPNNILPGVQIEPVNVSTIQFNETGLPSGQAWSVAVNGVITTSTSSTITVFVDTGTYNYTTNTSNDVDFKILPKSGSINVSAFTDYYVNIDYINISYPVVFYQNTLISGVSWSVWLNNTTVQKELSSTGNTVTFYATNGTYTYFVMIPVFDAVTFNVSPQTAGLGVDGPSFTYLTNITFTYSAYEVVFSQNGLIYPQSWSLVINGTTYKSNPSEQVVFWGNAHKNYSATINSPTPQIHPEQKTYNFTLNSSLSYTVDFVIDVTIVESGYTGEWHADVNNVEYTSTTNTIVAEVVPGYISISIWITDTGYTITPPSVVYDNILVPFTLNVTFTQTPTNYVTSIFGNLTFIYVIVFIGILIFAAVLVMKLRRR